MVETTKGIGGLKSAKKFKLEESLKFPIKDSAHSRKEGNGGNWADLGIFPHNIYSYLWTMFLKCLPKLNFVA